MPALEGIKTERLTTTPSIELTVHLIVHGEYTHIFGALRSLYAMTTTPCAVIVTINTGNAPQVDRLRAEFPNVTIIINDHPQGFAANHNAIMRQSTTPFIALLNDDVELHANALDRLVTYLKNHDDVALVGPALQNADTTPQVSAYSDPSLFRTLYKISGLSKWTHQESAARYWLQRSGLLGLLKPESLKVHAGTRPVPVIKGTVMVVRRTAYEQAGLMDEFTRAYGEEYGWHLRLRQAGWQLILVEEAQVTHYGKGQVRLELSGWQLLEDRKAALAYYLKYRSLWQALMVRAGIIVFHSAYALFWILLLQRQRADSHRQVAIMGLTFRL